MGADFTLRRLPENAPRRFGAKRQGRDTETEAVTIGCSSGTYVAKRQPEPVGCFHDATSGNSEATFLPVTAATIKRAVALAAVRNFPSEEFRTLVKKNQQSPQATCTRGLTDEKRAIQCADSESPLWGFSGLKRCVTFHSKPAQSVVFRVAVLVSWVTRCL